MTEPLCAGERRRFSRFQLPESSTFISSATWPANGVLMDIGIGGLSMQYNSDEPWPEAASAGCQISGIKELFIDRLPVLTVSDQIVAMDKGNSMIVRRRHLKFGLLSPDQRFLLECFIWISCIGHS